ncbi:MAG: FAD-dependent thymidylate synthase [Clostridia bacterium]|nr:FAD-dependent thymidylate synthase [Clostridia bacterium]
MKVKILDITTDALYNISMAARRCYNSREKDTLQNREAFVKGLIKSGHETPLEFCYVVFDVDGISRSCLQQLARHRIGVGMCVQSQRYVDQSNNRYVIPPSLDYNKNNDYKSIIFENAVQNCLNAYKELLALGVPKEDARFVLPEAMCTNLSIYFNFRELRHFLSLRLDKHAQHEIRALASEFKRLMIERGLGCIVEDIGE